MIKVLQAGFYSSVQDNGRYGGVAYGVPISGAMDSLSANLANEILGNKKDDSVFEMTMSGAKLQFLCETAICITGANMQPRLNDKEIEMFQTISVKPNDILSFGRLQNGLRSYLAVKRGFKTKKILNSRSWYDGITEHFRLKTNQTLDIEEYKSSEVSNAIENETIVDVFKNELDVHQGPEFAMLNHEQQMQLFTQEFTVSKNNNRMAYQLEELVLNNLGSILTGPVLPGTVQMTPSGKLIILMRDCQTTGGYPRILQLTELAVCRLAQKFTGGKVNFKLID